MNHWKVKNLRPDLSFEIAFTAAYRKAKKKYNHPAQIELACLQAQYPAVLMPIEDNDVLAGRIQFGLVGYGIQGKLEEQGITLMSQGSRKPLRGRQEMRNTGKIFMTCSHSGNPEIHMDRFSEILPKRFPR